MGWIAHTSYDRDMHSQHKQGTSPRDEQLIDGRRPRIFYGWWIVGSFGVLNIYWAGTLVSGLTVFFTPVRQTFGWSAALLALIFSGTSILTGLLAPLVGAWFDRAGARTLMLCASLLSGTGLLALSRTNSLPMFVIAFLVVSAGFGIWASGTGPAAATLWFVRRRGLAMGLILAGVSLGGFMVPLWKLVVSTAGWRTAFLIAGLGLLAVSLPCCLVLRHHPADIGLLPDGDLPSPISPSRAGIAAPATQPRGSLRNRNSTGSPAAVGLRVALRTRQFWVVSACASLVVGGSTAASVLMLPRLQDAHLNDGIAVAAVTAVTLLGAVARLGTGFLADRFGPGPLAACSVVLQAVGLFALAIAPQQLPVLLLFVLSFGFGSGNIRLLAAVMLAEYYGPAAFGRIQGAHFAALLPGTVIGPVIAGALHDGGHGYGAGFILFACVSLATAMPLLLLRAPVFAREGGISS